MTDAAPKPVPNVVAGQGARLGWWHRACHRLLLLGQADDALPPPIVDAPPEIQALVRLLEDHRSQFAGAARTLGADYKGGYWMMYLFAPFAVIVSAAAIGFGHYGRLLSAVELILVVLILVLYLAMRRGRWQEGWVRARRTAEHLRYLPLVAPWVTDFRLNWFEQFAARHGTQIGVEEEITVVCAWLGDGQVPNGLNLRDPAFYAGYVQYVDDVLAQQVHYHTHKAALEQALARRISLMSTGFFGITIVCTALLFLEALTTALGLSRYLPSNYLRFLATGLPALGGGLRGLLAQGESHRVAALSEGMANRLTQIRGQLKSIASSAVPDDRLENLVWTAVQELLLEADTWMRLQESVPLSVGG
jgi:hypothetical protein